MLVKRKSKIDGFGIFSNGKIEKGNVFYIVPLNIIYNYPKPRCAFIGKNKFVCDKKVLNYINHSCNPNAKLKITGKPRLISIKNINPGDEIVCNYNLTEKGGVKVKCTCGNKNCRGYFSAIRKKCL